MIEDIVVEVEQMLNEYLRTYPNGFRYPETRGDFGRWQDAEFKLRNILEEYSFRASWGQHGTAMVRLNGFREAAFTVTSVDGLGPATFSWLKKAKARLSDNSRRKAPHYPAIEEAGSASDPADDEFEDYNASIRAQAHSLPALWEA